MPESYFNLNQAQVDEVIVDLLRRDVPSGRTPHILEIGCGGMSTVTFGRLDHDGEIVYVLGTNIKQTGIDETVARGLPAKLVPLNYDYTRDFKELARSRAGVVAMLGLPEILPDIARGYALTARDSGLWVAAFPHLEL